MGASVRPDPVADYLSSLKGGGSDPVSDYLSALPAKAHDYHAEFASGKLQQRMQSANARDVESAKELDASSDVGQPGIAGSLADVAQRVPGMGAVQAKVRSIVRGEPYRDAYNAIKTQTDKVPTSAKVVSGLAMAVPMAAALPASPVTSGAILGGADQALDANPDKGFGSRLATGAAGAAIGGTVGKVVEGATTGLRALLGKNAATNVIDRSAQRAADADINFPKALAEGQGKTNTAKITRVLAEPDNAELVQELGRGRPLAGKAANSPEVLDALYKVRTDQARQIDKGLEAIRPNRPNIGRYAKQDIGMAKADLADAMAEVMPSYPHATETYAKQSAGIEGVENGQDALKSAISKAVTSGRNLRRTTPEAFSDYIANEASPEAAQGAREGIIGGLKEDFRHHPLANAFGVVSPVGGRAMSHAPGLLRRAMDPTQAKIDLLIKLGLIGANSTVQP